MRNSLLIVFIQVMVVLNVIHAQTVILPTIGSKTHPSMSVDSLVLLGDQTRIHIQIVNKNTEGTAWFCADRDISLIEKTTGKVHALIRSEGIPVCPESHAFQFYGEKLLFTLYFPALTDKKGEIDVIENCSEHCFSLKDIVTDPMLNQEIRQFEKAVSLYNEGKLVDAQLLFENVSNSSYTSENHFGYSLYILPLIYHKLGDYDRARLAYQRLKSSAIPEKKYFLQKILEIPFFSELE
jgi:tetratricopeptide (TPR) repeat protein